MGGAFSFAQGAAARGGPAAAPFLLAIESVVRSFIYALWYGPFPCAREGGSSLPSAPPSRCWSLLTASHLLSYSLLPSGFNLLLRIYPLFFCSMNLKKGILETYSQRKEFSCRLV